MDIGATGLYLCLFIALYFEVFLLISFFEKRPEKKSTALPRCYPAVTMLVPCYNEQATVGATIDSLLALDYPADKLDIMVVDDGSSDGTADIARRYAAQYPTRVALVQKANGGKYTALNIGIEQSKGELIGCLDADSFVEASALIEAVKKFESDSTIMAITPAMKVHKPRSLLELMQNVEYTFGIFYKKMFDNLSAINVLPGPFSMYKREVFKKIGLFRHAHNTEDMEIAFRMHANHLKIVNAHTAFVYTTVPNTVRTLLRQRVRWSQGFLMNARDYGYMFFNKRYGNFGMLILPFATLSFFAGIYTAAYAVYRITDMVLSRMGDFFATGIPLHVPPAPHLTWFYLNTNSMLFVIVAVLCMTLVAILLGNRIAQTGLGVKSFAAYFAFFGFLAPLWLMRAAWGAALARESRWR
ncbi:MAG: glycosyltransferase family 2 protein [Patescibacteria group bacterium]